MNKHSLSWQNRPASDLQMDDPLRENWDQLNTARSDLPFLAADAIVIALRMLGEGTERLLIAHKGTALIAMLILCPKGHFFWQTFQPSQLPLGAWVAHPTVTLQEVARSLMRGPLGFCLVLSMTQVDPLIAPRTEDTQDSRYTDYIDTGWIDIQGSFDEYWNSRGKNLRQNMRKQRAKLHAEGITLTLQVLHDHADMAPAIARYGDLESTGWKAQIGTAIHPENVQGKYYRALFENASERRESLVYQFLFDDRVVAMNLCLVRDGTLVVLKTTYDESIQSFSPAFLLRENELQTLFSEHRIKRMEYFGRLMEWHTKLTDKKRTLYHLTFFKWSFLKLMAQAHSRWGTDK